MSLWNPFLGRVTKGYCAFCKASRKYLHKKHLSFINYIFILLMSAIFGATIWEPGDPRFLVLFGFLVGSGEIFIYVKWRTSISCKHCGFDPVLYKASPGRAREKVRAFYESRIEKPEFLLSKSPLLEVHRQQVQNERLKAKLLRVKARRETSSLPPASPQ